MNNNFDTNFEYAYEISNRDFSHSELLEMLKCGNIAEKQIAALKLEGVNNQDEADILLSNLTGCDGKIREAAALKINQILRKNPTVKFSAETMAQASIDINGNICRLVIDSVSILRQDENFSKIYLERILEYIDSTFVELDKFIFRDKKYVINKQLFKLYWCLEALKLFAGSMDSDKLLKILERASVEKEYTIREKVAQILVLLEDEKFIPLKEKLKLDENYYVKNTLNHPGVFN